MRAGHHFSPAMCGQVWLLGGKRLLNLTVPPESGGGRSNRLRTRAQRHADSTGFFWPVYHHSGNSDHANRREERDHKKIPNGTLVINELWLGL